MMIIVEACYRDPITLSVGTDAWREFPLDSQAAIFRHLNDEIGDGFQIVLAVSHASR
jgi:hypothetical protein